MFVLPSGVSYFNISFIPLLDGSKSIILLFTFPRNSIAFDIFIYAEKKNKSRGKRTDSNFKRVNKIDKINKLNEISKIKKAVLIAFIQ